MTGGRHWSSAPHGGRERLQRDPPGHSPGSAGPCSRSGSGCSSAAASSATLAGPDGRPLAYTLTPAGQGLTPIIWAIGHWAAEWTFGDPEDEDCDGLSLMWRLHQHAITAKLPQQRTILHMTLTGAGAAEGWLNIDRGTITVCKDNPGYDVDLAIEASTGQMQRWLMAWSHSGTWLPTAKRELGLAGGPEPSRPGSTRPSSPKASAGPSNAADGPTYPPDADR